MSPSWSRARTASRRASRLLLALLAAAAAASCRQPGAGAARDPLAAEIARSAALARGPQPAGRARDDAGAGAGAVPALPPGLAGAREELRHGRRLLALERLAEARLDLLAVAYLRQRPRAEQQEAAAFEAEWARIGRQLGGDLAPPSAAALAGVRPAAARAMAEAALPQVRAYYQASRDYGLSTTPAAGLYYLGEAQALDSFVAFCRSLGRAFPRRDPPRLRALDGELDDVQAEVLAAYRPPASVAQHGSFIAIGSILKEARELNAAGLRYGALLRTLQAALALAPLRPPPAVPAAAHQAAELHALAARLSQGETDHSIGQLFVQLAEANLEAARAGGAGAGDPTVAAIVHDVLPRYLAALGPALPPAPRPPAAVTVTLVRWPYT
jgi:hypothetical protein